MSISKSGNDLCRRCRFLQKKVLADSVFPIYYCKMHPKGLDSAYMNDWNKECFEAKVTGPWRMPIGTFEEKDFERYKTNGEIDISDNLIE